MPEVRDVHISVVVDTDTYQVEEMRYVGELDLDRLHEVLMQEFPKLALKE